MVRPADGAGKGGVPDPLRDPGLPQRPKKEARRGDRALGKTDPWGDGSVKGGGIKSLGIIPDIGRRRKYKLGKFSKQRPKTTHAPTRPGMPRPAGCDFLGPQPFWGPRRPGSRRMTSGRRKASNGQKSPIIGPFSSRFPDVPYGPDGREGGRFPAGRSPDGSLPPDPAADRVRPRPED
ncbi:MAG: hypothetical protein ACE5DO_08195 [Desulfobacterales bacterium]